ncbi:ABC transporter permease [Falsiporphyromonas endometrii]|uniref:ABC transporter permease n=1 Tax=Falsiporphyromonas endometrii TaxID=1387297 RepID=A0ABV9K9J9_9PORP
MKSKIGIIIGREFGIRVRKKSFLVMTILMPILFIGIITLPIFLAKFSSSEIKTVAVIDATGKYLPLLKDTDDFHFIAADKPASAYRSEGSKDCEVEAVVDISGPILVGDSLTVAPDRVNIYSFKQMPTKLQEYVNTTLSSYLTNERLKLYNINNLDEIMQRAEVHVNPRTFKWNDKGELERTSGDIAGVLGLVLTFVSYLFIMMYGAMVLSGVLEEKKSRIMEVMVCSVKPFDLMMGKIIGIGLVGLLQIVLWIVLSAGLIFGMQFLTLGGIYDSATIANMQMSQMQGGMLSSGMSAENLNQMQDIMSSIASINFGEILSMFMLYFIGGYLLYASLFAAIGAAVSNDEDTNQFMIPVSVIMLFSFYAALGSKDNPEGPLAFWSSMIPFTSPVVMMVRLPYDVPIWQEILSVAILFATFVLVTWIAAKIYRVGILMYGKKPSLKEMWHWISYK